ncbi:MAG: hypothetical protein PHT49_00215 [Desulfovibrionales bacterium]|nr:hypothetical protein [Desulfovibrionales bacterium]
MSHYDLALVFVSFQRCCVYLSIVKELSSQYRIAICPQAVDEKTHVRTKKTIDEFLALCESFGADIIYDEKITANIEILPQTNYTKETIDNINNNIASTKTFWLSGLAMGNAQYEYLYGKKIDKILVIDRNFYNYRVNEYERPAGHKFRKEDIVEMGVPYKKYPIFPDYGIDYLWANPTPFSFCCVKDRLEYLENVFSLIKLVDVDDVIVLKPHNADERVDYIVNERIYSILRNKIFSPFYSFIDGISRKIAAKLRYAKIADFFLNISIAIMYVKLMRRVVRFRDITELHNLNLELFLPNVRKGLITGRSNSIWHGLFNKIPVYNCIDENKKYYSDTKMHKYSMKYLNVHGNYSTLEFDSKLYDLIDTKTRKADLIMFIKEQLDG